MKHLIANWMVTVFAGVMLTVSSSPAFANQDDAKLIQKSWRNFKERKREASLHPDVRRRNLKSEIALMSARIGDFHAAKKYRKQEFAGTVPRDPKSRESYYKDLQHDDESYHLYKYISRSHLESFQKYGVDTVFGGRDGASQRANCHDLARADAGLCFFGEGPCWAYERYLNDAGPAPLLLVKVPKKDAGSLNLVKPRPPGNEWALAGTELPPESIYVRHDSDLSLLPGSEEHLPSTSIRKMMSEPVFEDGKGYTGNRNIERTFVPIRLLKTGKN